MDIDKLFEELKAIAWPHIKYEMCVCVCVCVMET